jgi:hypothetical protein
MGISVFRVPRRLYWTADRGRLVQHGDVDAAFLAFPAGHELALEEARRFGLLDTVDTPVTAEKLAAEPPNKMRGRAANKGVKPVATGAHIENNFVETTDVVREKA